MIGCLRTRARKQPNIALYFEFENELEFSNLETRMQSYSSSHHDEVYRMMIPFLFLEKFI